MATSPKRSQRDALIQGRKHRYSRHLYISRVLVAPTVCLLAALARKAWLDLDTAWDSLAYHLPFAALRSGILSPRQYRLSHWIGACYAGFPVLPDYLKGWLWRLTSRPQAANVVGLFALLVLAWLLWRTYRVPMTDTLLAFLAIPIVLIQSTSAYNDLLANSAMAVLLLLIFRALTWPGRVSLRDLLGTLVALAVVMNCKLQFLPVGTLALATLAGGVYINRRRFVCLRGELRRATPVWRCCVVGVISVAIGLSYSKSFQNWRAFGNPVYPVAVHIGPLKLPGQFHKLGTEPEYLAKVPQALRWALSVLEYDAFDGRRPLWSNGQGDVQLHSPALRMGGYLGVFVLFNIFWFVFLQVRVRRRFRWKPGLFLCLVTVVTAVLPASQELRYYLHWMLCLVSLNLILILHGLRGDERFNARLCFLGGAVSCLLFVLSSSGGAYLCRTGADPDRLARDLGITKQLSSMNLRPGEAVCVIGKNPLTFLYAPIFNLHLASATHYAVLEAYSPDDCSGARIVP